MESFSPLPVLEQHDLIAAVRQALEAPAVSAIDWHVRPLSGGYEASSSVYHVTGHAWANGQRIRWDVVLKVIRPTTDRLDIAHWNYWKREAHAYHSGLLQSNAAGLGAPRCYDISERPDGSIWLWLEALSDAVSKPWPLTTYETVARQLGIFNGSHLAHSSQPTEPWVSRGWLRRYINDYGTPLAQLPNLQGHALVQRLFPPHIAEGLFQFWQERETFLAVLDHLPQTFCHLDAWHANLFITHNSPADTRVVAVDWAFSGIGAIGQECAPLIGTSWTDCDPGMREAIEERAVAGYVDGLRAAGWNGNERDVLLGYATAVALTYGLGAAGWILGIVLDKRQHAWWEHVTGQTVEAGLEQMAALADIYLQRADQARRLNI